MLLSGPVEHERPQRAAAENAAMNTWSRRRLMRLDAKEAEWERKDQEARAAHARTLADLVERVPDRRWQDRSALDPKCAMGVLLRGLLGIEESDDAWEPGALVVAWLVGLGWLDGTEDDAQFDYAYWQYWHVARRLEVASGFYDRLEYVCDEIRDGAFDFVAGVDGDEEYRAQVLDSVASCGAAYARVEDEAFCPVPAADLHAGCDAVRRRFEEIWEWPGAYSAVTTMAEALVLGCRLAGSAKCRGDQLRRGLAGAGPAGEAALDALDARLGSYRRHNAALRALRTAEAALCWRRVTRARRRLMGTALSRRVMESAWWRCQFVSASVRWAAYTGSGTALRDLDEVQSVVFRERLFGDETLAQVISSKKRRRDG